MKEEMDKKILVESDRKLVWATIISIEIQKEVIDKYQAKGFNATAEGNNGKALFTISWD
jgi:hypothetical protein